MTGLAATKIQLGESTAERKSVEYRKCAQAMKKKSSQMTKNIRQSIK
jgi:hypothetical protein